MITKLRVPKLSANVDEAVITAWFKKEGDAVRKAEPVVEMTTDKAAFDVPSPRGGTLRKTLAAEKSSLPVGYIFALIGKPDEPLPDVSQENTRALSKHRRQASTREVTVQPKPSPSKGGGGLRATPAARRLAKQHGLDLADIGRHAEAEVITGRIVEQYMQEHGA